MLSNRKGRFFSIAISVTLALSLVAITGGCSSSSPSKSSASSKALSGTITEGSWTDANTSMVALAKQFMKENPGTTVNAIKVDGVYTKLGTELAAGSGVPDIVQTQNRDFQSFMNKYPDAWLDVTDMVKPEESNFVPFVLPLVSKNSKYYAVPWDIGPCALLYRKDIFKSAGVDVSTIKTYDDYIAAGKRILASTNGKTKMLGFDYNGATSRDLINLLFNENGGQYYGSDGKVNLNSTAMNQTFNLLKKMVSAGVTMDLPNEWNDRLIAISNDQLATVPYAVWYAGTLQNAENSSQSGKWGIAPLPAFIAGGNTEANWGGSILAISSSTKNAALAKAFVKFCLMNHEGIKIDFVTAAHFTSYKPAYADDEYTASSSFFGTSVGSTFSSYSANISHLSFGPYFTDVDNALITAVGNIFIKNVDPSKALTDASTAAQKAIDNE